VAARAHRREDPIREVNVELLIGCKVFDEDGKAIGRVEEVLAIERGDELVVSEYHVGKYGLMERLSVYHFGVGLLRFLGARGHLRDPKRIPWQELDLSDPQRPVWRNPRRSPHGPESSTT
jgi:sporulation protein YlmC with PRC-barrel domain